MLSIGSCSYEVDDTNIIHINNVYILDSLRMTQWEYPYKFSNKGAWISLTLQTSISVSS